MKGFIIFILLLVVSLNTYSQVLKEVKFDEVELKTVIKSLAEALELNIIIDPEISEILDRKTSVNISRPLSATEAFNIILKEHGLIAVPVDTNIYKITKADEITIKFETLDEEAINRLIEILKPLVSPSARITIDKKLKTVHIWDEEKRILKIRELEEDIKREVLKEEKVEFITRVFYLKKNIPVDEAEKLIEALNLKDAVIRTSPEFNAIIVTAREEDIKRIEEVLKNLKERTEVTKPVITKVLYLKYIDAETFKRLIQGMLSDIGEVYILGRGITATTTEERELREIQVQIENLTRQLERATEAEKAVIERRLQVLRERERELKRIIEEASINRGDAIEISGFPSIQLGTIGPEFKKQKTARTLFANAIVIRDYVDVVYRIMEKYKDIISEEPIQIKIQARIVEVSRSYLRELGISWDMFFSQARVPQFWQGGVTANSQITSGLIATPLTPGISATTGGLAVFSYRRGILNALNLKLSALERIGKARSISQPTVYTLNGEPAVITEALEFPIVRVTVSGNAFSASAEYKVIPMVLAVTPVLTPDNRIMLDITIARQDIVDFVRVPVSVNPPIDQEFPITLDRRMDTKVIINNGDMIVIGGIIAKSETESEEGVPKLMRIPLLGWLFKQERIDDRDRELLIFIKPEVISGF